MTTAERLARLEQKVDDLPEVILEKLDKRYYTRREGRAISAVLGLLVVILGAWDTVKGHIK